MSASNHPSKKDNPIPEVTHLIEHLVERENMIRAYEKVKRNKGAAGHDGMEVSSLKEHLDKHWSSLKESLLGSRYYPEGVLQVEILKPNGGIRKLGIPTVVDRLIQQSLHQVLSPIFEPYFSPHSYGFREGKSAEDAIKSSQFFIQQGYDWVVDMDLEKFFDEVPHDVLMGKIRKRVKDKAVLRLIRRYLEADVMVKGKRERRTKGVPQGGASLPATLQHPA